MLLRHTPKEIKEREVLTINPVKTCQPIGAMYAALGIHGCLPHSHGSQGCCAYHRSMLTRHYKEPVMAATSSFTEGSSVFGGQANLVQSINNIFTIYNPDVIAVHTTCLSETIGDDVNQIVAKSRDDGKVPRGKHVIHASTPSYTGSHVTGFSNMVTSIATYFPESSGKKMNQVNIIPGYVEPADMREIKRIAALMGVKVILFPDTDGVLNTPMTGKYEFYPAGGVKINALRSAGDSLGTIALGPFASSQAARALDSKCKVPIFENELPIGLEATDRWINQFRKIAGINVPDELDFERGQLLDFMADMQQYFYRKKVALAGDPDHIIAMTEFLITLNMQPTHIVTGTPGLQIEKKLKELAPRANIKVKGDLFHLHQLIKNDPVDLIIGNTHCKYIARDEDIPLLRLGWPIVDRVGHQYFPIIGYQGAMRLLEKILDKLLDRKDRDAPESKFELVL